jgi:ubiquinone/menaquinone biosynthesis C-methylase UbiE
VLGVTALAFRASQPSWKSDLRKDWNVRDESNGGPGRGGYDEGYAKCSHLWGLAPGSLVSGYFESRDPAGQRVLDVGCGDGKNALWLASKNARVVAIDISSLAIERAKEHDKGSLVSWLVADVTQLPLSSGATFDSVILYGVLHCLNSDDSIRSTIEELKCVTRPGGVNFTVAFNDRDQDLEAAHAGFEPTLLPHARYLEAYGDWEILKESDELLFESHPHNNIPHHHSMTRIVARKPA